MSVSISSGCVYWSSLSSSSFSSFSERKVLPAIKFCCGHIFFFENVFVYLFSSLAECWADNDFQSLMCHQVVWHEYLLLHSAKLELYLRQCRFPLSHGQHYSDSFPNNDGLQCTTCMFDTKMSDDLQFPNLNLFKSA
jgi:hypothetical protein